ncbi:MAG: hypothetical protein AAFW73_09690 [Bacteroidota bacterium]
MKKSFSFSLPLVAFAVLVLSACNKTDDDLPTILPACIENTIQVLGFEPGAGTHQEMYRGSYRGEVVYYWTGDQIADGWSSLYSADCQLLCHPDGGVDGRGDGRCTDFERSELQLVWEHPR